MRPIVRGSEHLSVGDHPALASATVMGLELYGVEEAETAFRLGTGLPADVVAGEMMFEPIWHGHPAAGGEW